MNFIDMFLGWVYFLYHQKKFKSTIPTRSAKIVKYLSR